MPMKNLEISKDDFEKPKNLSINVDCSKVDSDSDSNQDDNTPEDLDF